MCNGRIIDHADRELSYSEITVTVGDRDTDRKIDLFGVAVIDGPLQFECITEAAAGLIQRHRKDWLPFGIDCRDLRPVIG